MNLELERIDGVWAVARLPASTPIPEWTTDAADFMSITRTRTELSIVAPDACVPVEVTAERDMALWRVAGVIDFNQVGVLARITAPLAAAGVTVFAIATFDTDYLLLRSSQCDDATRAWRSAGVHVR